MNGIVVGDTHAERQLALCRGFRIVARKRMNKPVDIIDDLDQALAA